MRGFCGASVAALLLVGLSACGNGGSAVETRERDEPAKTVPYAAVQDEVAAPLQQVAAPSEAPAQSAVILTSNRRETAGAKAIRLYERNGADFGATSAEDYLEKAKSFTRSPPADAEKISRPNGDTLIYQARTNTFAVVDKRGVVRTMFKPSNGADYWERQKATAGSFGR
ncbi:S-type pyocin family protein [Brevundimonas sp.]|uniref:S-type pyocin family protein n=1 Tax=Brevundimonas sp. TaxID=1871086 RepID=UPI0028A26AC4|nr:S-type pyocin family protein [Brevundimonas sp.]